MKYTPTILLFFIAFLGLFPLSVNAATERVIFESTSAAVATASPSPSPEPVITPRPDITQRNDEISGPLENLLTQQEIGSLSPFNFFKHAIRNAVRAGVPANTIVLLLLTPLIASIIATARHLVGIRGFGIFLPASLSVVFLATGPVVGIALFLIIVAVSTLARLLIRKSRLNLSYLPRMALILWFVILGVLALLFAAPYVSLPGLTNVSIFPVLILVLLAEDFTKVQLGKNIKTAVNLTSETLILSLVSYIFLTLKPLQQLALLNPEGLLIGIVIFDIIIGKYVGLRFLEFWRFRKLISS